MSELGPREPTDRAVEATASRLLRRKFRKGKKRKGCAPSQRTCPMPPMAQQETAVVMYHHPTGFDPFNSVAATCDIQATRRMLCESFEGVASNSHHASAINNHLTLLMDKWWDLAMNNTTYYHSVTTCLLQARTNFGNVSRQSQLSCILHRGIALRSLQDDLIAPAAVEPLMFSIALQLHFSICEGNPRQAGFHATAIQKFARGINRASMSPVSWMFLTWVGLHFCAITARRPLLDYSVHPACCFDSIFHTPADRKARLATALLMPKLPRPSSDCLDSNTLFSLFRRLFLHNRRALSNELPDILPTIGLGGSIYYDLIKSTGIIRDWLQKNDGAAAFPTELVYCLLLAALLSIYAPLIDLAHPRIEASVVSSKAIYHRLIYALRKRSRTELVQSGHLECLVWTLTITCAYQDAFHSGEESGVETLEYSRLSRALDLLNIIGLDEFLRVLACFPDFKPWPGAQVLPTRILVVWQKLKSKTKQITMDIPVKESW